MRYFSMVLIVASVIGLPLQAQPEVEWMRLYGDEVVDQFFAHIQTEDGGWAFAGRKGSRPATQWVVKTDQDGEEQFQGQYTIDDESAVAHELVQAEDGGYVIAGSISIDEGVRCSGIRVDEGGEQI